MRGQGSSGRDCPLGGLRRVEPRGRGLHASSPRRRRKPGFASWADTFGAFNAANGLRPLPVSRTKPVRERRVAVCSQTGPRARTRCRLPTGATDQQDVRHGNKCDVDEVDVMEYLATIRRRRWCAAPGGREGRPALHGSGAAPGGPQAAVVLKTGRTSAEHAPRLHTRLADGSDHVYDAAFRQVGALRVATWQQLWRHQGAAEQQATRASASLITITGGQGS